MTIRKVFDVEVRVDGSEVTLLFTAMHGGIAEKDTEGDLLRFGMSINRDAQGLAGLVHDFTRWLTGLCVKEVQAQQAQIQLATSQTPATQAEPAKRGKKTE